MKKWIMVMLSFVFLYTMVACYQVPHEGTSDTIMPEIASSVECEVFETLDANSEKNDAQETTLVGISPTPSNENVNYPITTAFADTPTRLLYVKSGIVYYCNKFTEGSYKFCFDPLCRHRGYDCISYKFEMAAFDFQSIKYCEYDNRFYALRGEQFCSFAFDGSDLKIEYSFGDEGNFETELRPYSYGGIIYLQIQGKNICFLAIDNESGKRVLMHYNAETKKMMSLFRDYDTSIYGYLLDENGVYISVVGNYSGLYYISYDGSNMKLISQDSYESFAKGIFDGERYYFIQTSQRYNEEQNRTSYIPEKVVAFVPQSGMLEDVFVIETKNEHKLLAVTDQYIYYTVREPISVGDYTAMGYPQNISNDYSRIYRYDIETGKIVTVLDEPRCETRMIYFVDDTVFILGVECIVNETMASRRTGGFTAKLDENGMFTELTRMED